MNRYLAALKLSEARRDATQQNQHNPVENRSVGFVGTPAPLFDQNPAANDYDLAVDSSPQFAWQVYFSDRESVTVSFSPMADRATVIAQYPDAVGAAPVSNKISWIPIADDVAKLRALINGVYTDDSPDDQNDALQAALADPVNALACYAAIASEGGLTHVADDRHSCKQCTNLRAGVCTVARHGGEPSARRGYRPSTDLPHRCQGFCARVMQ